jgi:hypothetical protein
VGSTWIHRETGLIVDAVGVDGQTLTLRSTHSGAEWIEFTDGFLGEYEEVQ